MKRLCVDHSKCIGCHLCELACSMFHEGVYNPAKARLRVQGYGLPTLFAVRFCRHCDEPRCAINCPQEVIRPSLDSKSDAAVYVLSEDECSGCMACVGACEYDAVFEHPNTGMPLKCDMCGGDPECVKVCRPGAISFKEAHEDRTMPEDVIRKRLEALRLMPEDLFISW